VLHLSNPHLVIVPREDMLIWSYEPVQIIDLPSTCNLYIWIRVHFGVFFCTEYKRLLFRRVGCEDIRLCKYKVTKAPVMQSAASF